MDVETTSCVYWDVFIWIYQEFVGGWKGVTKINYLLVHQTCSLVNILWIAFLFQRRLSTIVEMIIFCFVCFILLYFIICATTKNSHPEVFCKRDVLKNIAKFTGKQLCQNLLFNKLEDLFNKMSLVAASIVHLFGISITAAVAVIAVGELFWMLWVIRLCPQEISNLVTQSPPPSLPSPSSAKMNDRFTI